MTEITACAPSKNPSALEIHDSGSRLVSPTRLSSWTRKTVRSAHVMKSRIVSRGGSYPLSLLCGRLSPGHVARLLPSALVHPTALGNSFLESSLDCGHEVQLYNEGVGCGEPRNYRSTCLWNLCFACSTLLRHGSRRCLTLPDGFGRRKHSDLQLRELPALCL